MKVTTVRFGTDLWALLELEAAEVGVSVSQYIREAALARASAAAAARGQPPFEALAAAVREIATDDPDAERRRAAQVALAGLARLSATEIRADRAAVTGESEQARREALNKRRRARDIADEARARRGRSDG